MELVKFVIAEDRKNIPDYYEYVNTILTKTKDFILKNKEGFYQYGALNDFTADEIESGDCYKFALNKLSNSAKTKHITLRPKNLSAMCFFCAYFISALGILLSDLQF